MLHKVFFAQNVMQTAPPPPVGNVMFTVKLWELDKDNDFVDTEVMPLQNITVKIGTTEKQTNASGQVDFNLSPGTYTYQVYKMDVPLTTVQGSVEVTGTHNVGVKLYGCKYTPAEVWLMVLNENYVPVATASELDGLRNTGSRTMGAGTIWVGSYATGIANRKYISCASINLYGYNWIRLAEVSAFISPYDGNGLIVYNLFSNANVGGLSSSLFGNTTDIRNLTVQGAVYGENQGIGLISNRNDGIIDNVSVYGFITNNGVINVGLICGINNGKISNSFAKGNASGTSYIGGITGLNTAANCEIIKCDYKGELSGATLIGGITGDSTKYIGYCSTTVKITITGEYSGGIAGHNNGNIIEHCRANVDITNSARHAGGITGRNGTNGNIRYCETSGIIRGNTTRVGGITGVSTAGPGVSNSSSSITILSTSAEVGGLIGNLLNSVINCFSVGIVNGSTSTTGGLIGLNTGTVTNSYYDTQTSGRSDTGKGLPRTTAQMKAGTADSFINPDGSVDLTQASANAMFTGWLTTIWNFRTTNDYPILK
jgi:hypothetical protein